MHLKRKWVSTSICIGSVLVTGIAASACGSSKPSVRSRSSVSKVPSRILDTRKIEGAIERSALTQRGEHARVTCPAGIHQEDGLVFSCTAIVGNASTRFIVTELDGSGQVHYVAR
jgi:hypothetical protein